MKRNALLIAIMLAACTSDSTPSGPELLAGFEPPAPGPGEIQVVGPVVDDIPPGSDIMYCSYLDGTYDHDIDVTAFAGYQSSSGHHVLLYAANRPQAPNTHECTEDDMLNVRRIAAGGAEGTPNQALPDGIVMRVPANTQLMLQSHWINASDDPISGQGAFNLKVQDPRPGVEVAQGFANVNTMFALQPGAAKATARCEVKEKLQFINFAGHMHRRGTHISISVTRAGTTEMLYDREWLPAYESHPPQLQYTKDAPLTFNPGDVITTNCDFMNETGAMMYFPTEMCVAFGDYFPGDHEIHCVDGGWDQ
jgi:hypothetical protein